MIHKVGDIVLETSDINKAMLEQDMLVMHHGFKRGDKAVQTDLDMFTYAIVVNDEYYADVEYRVRSSGKLLSLEEMNSILKIVTNKFRIG